MCTISTFHADMDTDINNFVTGNLPKKVGKKVKYLDKIVKN